MLAASLVLFVHLFYFIYFAATVFMHWDPVVSWNRFALDWTANKIPTQTWRYPQLIPANWSISYVLMGTSQVQVFAKSIMAFFSIGTMTLFADLAFKTRSAVYWFALIIYGVFLGFLYNPSVIVSGYVDIAVSFFSFLAFHAMYSLDKQRDTQKEKTNTKHYFTHILFAFTFACAAAVTKQSGFFILMIVTVWMIISLAGKRHEIPIKKILLVISISVVIFFILTASWYILKEIQIQHGLEQSEVAMVQEVHKIGSYVERFRQGMRNLISYRSPKLKVIPIAIMALVFFGLFHRKSWWVTLVIVIPYSLIWGFFFSYDTRNLSIAVPFIAFSSAYGATWLKKTVFNTRKDWLSFRLPLLPLVAIALIILILLNFTLLKKENIIRQQEKQMLHMGELELNTLLTNFYKNQGLKGKIASNYLYLKYLPGLKDYFVLKSGRVTLAYLKYLETDAGNDIRYLLMPLILKSEKDVMIYFQEQIQANRYKMIFKNRGYWFVDVKNQGAFLKNRPLDPRKTF
jgi:hypothetical protein